MHNSVGNTKIKRRYFSFLELLVVIFVIASIGAMFSGQGGKLYRRFAHRSEAERLQKTFMKIQQYSFLKGMICHVKLLSDNEELTLYCPEMRLKQKYANLTLGSIEPSFFSIYPCFESSPKSFTVNSLINHEKHVIYLVSLEKQIMK